MKTFAYNEDLTKETQQSLSGFSVYSPRTNVQFHVFCLRMPQEQLIPRLPARPFAGILKLLNKNNYQVCRIILSFPFLVLLLHQ